MPVTSPTRWPPPFSAIRRQLRYRAWQLPPSSPARNADLVVWSCDPLDVLSRVEHALIDGTEIYSYADGEAQFAQQ